MQSNHPPGYAPKQRCVVCAVIVTYFPDPATLRKVLHSTGPQVDAVVIVDNTPRDKAIDLITLTSGLKLPAHQTIQLGENRGIAAAQNAGISWAQSQDTEYVLLLDQDSIPDSGMVKQLVDTANKLLAAGARLAAIGPRYVDPRSGRSSTALQIGAVSLRRIGCNESLPNEVLRCDTLISSGSLIRIEALRKIGNFDASLFIDHVDNDWCLRTRHHGYSVYLACGIVMTHQLGAEITRYWFGRWRAFPAHPPTRHYYMLRNVFLLARRPHVPAAWLLGTFSHLLPILAAALILLPNRGARLLLILRAVYDGLRNRSEALGT